MTQNLDIKTLGQVFTPFSLVKEMISLRQRRGRVLEPSAGDGAFSNHIKDCIALEKDSKITPAGFLIKDFFAYSEKERFDTIIGNPPYVRYQDILSSTKKLLKKETMLDKRSNLYLFFIAKAVRHLNPGGELIFIVPRDFIKSTSAKKLNEWLYGQGSITHFRETGDTRIFSKALPNCAIFRFEKGLKNRKMDDGRNFLLRDGQFIFSKNKLSDNKLGDFFEIKVGAVSGADKIFANEQGNQDFVFSKTQETQETKKMIFNIPHKTLKPYKEILISRRIRKFNENNWWMWGRNHHKSDAPRIYVNAKTRKIQPFFTHECTFYDGSILALFPKNKISLKLAIKVLNDINWQELGFVVDGRFLFSQSSLAGCPVSKNTAKLLQ